MERSTHLRRAITLDQPFQNEPLPGPKSAVQHAHQLAGAHFANDVGGWVRHLESFFRKPGRCFVARSPVSPLRRVDAATGGHYVLEMETTAPEIPGDALFRPAFRFAPRMEQGLLHQIIPCRRIALQEVDDAAQSPKKTVVHNQRRTSRDSRVAPWAIGP
jgi:hypothetical protein